MEGSDLQTKRQGIQSEKAGKEMQEDYNLAKAEDIKSKRYELRSAFAQKLHYTSVAVLKGYNAGERN